MATLSCRLDRELDRKIRAYMRRNNLERSQAVRELLRQSLTDADDVTRGWREGFAKGYGEAQRALHQAASDRKAG